MAYSIVEQVTLLILPLCFIVNGRVVRKLSRKPTFNKILLFMVLFNVLAMLTNVTTDFTKKGMAPVGSYWSLFSFKPDCPNNIFSVFPHFRWFPIFDLMQKSLEEFSFYMIVVSGLERRTAAKTNFLLDNFNVPFAIAFTIAFVFMSHISAAMDSHIIIFFTDIFFPFIVVLILTVGNFKLYQKAKKAQVCRKCL